MNVLLDTCCVIWAVSEPESLGPSVRQILGADDTQVHVSCMSCAEIACLTERGRIVLDRHWKPWFDHYTTLNGWRILDTTLDVVQEAWSLPGEFHRDPVDRILVATSRLHRLRLLTADRKILGYPHVEAMG